MLNENIVKAMISYCHKAELNNIKLNFVYIKQILVWWDEDLNNYKE